MKKFVSIGVLTLVGIVAGFIFLLRGCLAKYDERSVITTPLFFENNGQPVVFSLVKFDKTISYSRSGNFVRKSVNSSYFIETVNGITGEKIGEKKIKKSNDIKSWPVEMLGASDNTAWLFAGELLAYNPITLDEIADKALIETKNPELKNQLPTERRFYDFDKEKNRILFTALNGNKYELTPATYLCTLQNEEVVAENNPDAIAKKIKLLRDSSNRYHDRFKSMNKEYQSKNISYQQYQEGIKGLEASAQKLRDEIAILEKQKQAFAADGYAKRDLQSKLEDFKEFISFSKAKTSVDTFNGTWYALGTPEWIAKQKNRVYLTSASYGEADRNRFYKGPMTYENSGDRKNALIPENKTAGNLVFLQGGFAINPETAMPFHLQNPEGFFVLYKNQIGNEGMVQIARIDTDGNKIWEYSILANDIKYWQLKNNRLFIFTLNNKELTGSEVNLMHSIDISTGKGFAYDFFTDKKL